MTDLEFEHYLALLGSLLRLDKRQREAIGMELRDHLEERMEELVAEGHTRASAVRIALEEFGDASGLAQKFIWLDQKKRRRWMMRFATFSIAGSFVACLLIFSLWPEQDRLPLVSRSAAQEQAAPPLGQTPVDSVEARNARTRNMLDQTILDFDHEEQSFADILDHWREIGFEFYLDDSSDLTLETPVTLKLRNVRLSTALELLLREHNSGYIIRDGLVLIASVDALHELGSEIRVYNCRDLVGRTEQSASGIPLVGSDPLVAPKSDGPADGNQAHAPNEIEGDFVSMIRSVVMPTSWEEMGNSAEMFDGLLVVSQSPKVHESIEQLLAKLREITDGDAAASTSRIMGGATPR
jgi:hypothetical protein